MALPCGDTRSGSYQATPAPSRSCTSSLSSLYVIVAGSCGLPVPGQEELLLLPVDIEPAYDRTHRDRLMLRGQMPNAHRRCGSWGGNRLSGLAGIRQEDEVVGSLTS